MCGEMSEEDYKINNEKKDPDAVSEPENNFEPLCLQKHGGFLIAE